MKDRPADDLRKAVIYARYSSHGQTEQSIEGQLHDCRAWARQNNYAIVSEYVDRALTGTKDARPDFQRMISDASKHQFEAVIVWKLDRFARNRYDSAIYKARLKKHGVRVISVKENISDSPEGIILEGLLESMAEYYSANLSQNVRRGLRETTAKGLFCGGNIPLGYKLVDRKLVRDEKTAPLVRWVFEQYAAGVPKKEIVEELNRRGLRNRRGGPYGMTAFQDTLRLRTYIGEHMYNGAVVPGLAEPIVSRELFDKVQERIAAAARAPAARKAKVPYILQGKVFCGLCGSPMVGESGASRNGTVHHYYACSRKKKSHACAKKNERREDLESFVIRQTMEYVLSPARVKRIAKAVAEEYRREFSGSRVAELEKAAAQLDRELEKLVDALTAAPASARPRIYARMDLLESQKADLESEASKLRIAMGHSLSASEVAAWLKSLRSGDPEDPSFRANLVDTFVNSVFVYADRVVILYNVNDAKKVDFQELSATLKTKENSESVECSDSESLGGAYHFKSEPINSEPTFLFVRGVLCFIFRCA